MTITGSWCPNCYDEAPVLQEFYERYRDRGLEVVALSFEYTGDAARDAKQVGIFAKRLGVTYPVLYAGAVEEAEKKLSQLVNFGAYPTTIYIGRDGLVKHIHAGFEGKATGERFARLKTEMETMIEDLLQSQMRKRRVMAKRRPAQVQPVAIWLIITGAINAALGMLGVIVAV